MDASSVIVILGAIVVILGLSLMRRGSRGAQNQPPEDNRDDDEHMSSGE
jgi:hypothetical protein